MTMNECKGMSLGYRRRRSLVLLIDEMLKEIPSNERSLIAYFKDIQSSHSFSASKDYAND